ncbi:hypothetical protein CEXT_622591 [Caerostris extrusa]|uniref:Uncharacterized protein n=1 Tax=Caerostris extrusa TaxID=172846 RepID=A0AAV4MV37_CAEEX|nr:hypothetical protein CEXT_622591 [Caerostris extrusa]
MGFERQGTLAYHPQLNGCIECWDRTLKPAILSHETKGWPRSFPFILLGLHTTWHTNFHSTPTEILSGENIRLPCALFENTSNEPKYEFVESFKGKFFKS